MNTTLVTVLASALLFCASSLPAVTILSVQPVNPAQTGHNLIPVSGSDAAESAIFTLSQSYVNVTVSADIGCCGSTLGEAFLTTAEGTGTTPGAEIASASFNGASSPTTVNLFTIPNLPANTYYLILTGISGLIGWEQATTSFTVTGDSGNTLVGNRFAPSASPGSYVPGFNYQTLGTANQSHIFSLTGTAIPEPSTLVMLLPCFAALAAGRFRRRR